MKEGDEADDEEPEPDEEPEDEEPEPDAEEPEPDEEEPEFDEDELELEDELLVEVDFLDKSTRLWSVHWANTMVSSKHKPIIPETNSFLALIVA